MMPPSTDLLTPLILALFQAHGRVLEWGDRFAAPHGLTSARWQMLGAIALAERPLTTPAIAHAMGVTRQGAQKQINRLLADGLLERLPNPSHQRSPHYALTPAGAARYAALTTQWREVVARLAPILPPAVAEPAHQTLLALAQAFSTPEGL